MGYSADYYIRVNNVSNTECLDIIKKLSQFECFTIYSDNDFGTYAKGYEYKEQIGKVSKIYPKALFIITCIGEDGERGRTYIQNGKYQDAECHITYDEFNISKLIKI